MAWLRIGCSALLLVALGGCGKNNGGNDGPQPSRVVLRANLGVDLAQVSAFAAVSRTSTPSQLRRDRLTPLDGELDAGTSTSTQLYALTLSGETLEVKLAEQGTPGAQEEVTQPGVVAVYPTASWVLFSAPAFCLDPPRYDGTTGSPGPSCIGCGIIAARRADGALFCAPMNSSDWTGGEPYKTIRASAAGDVLYTVAGILNEQGMAPEDTVRLYKITLGGADGPSAAPAYAPLTLPIRFEVNAAGDLYVVYPTSVMDPTGVREIRPADGAAPYAVPGNNSSVVAGEVGQADEDSFYFLTSQIEGQGFDGTIRIVSKSGATFTDTTASLNLANATAYDGLFRLSDGIYMFNLSEKSLVRVIASGALVTNPTPIPLQGVDRVVAGYGSQGIVPVGGRWVFIAATGAGYKFVRHDGIVQQDIPFDANFDIRSFTVSTDGAIDFLAVRLDTQEKVRGTVAAEATEVTTASAGVLDPAQVVVFTRIN